MPFTSWVGILGSWVDGRDRIVLLLKVQNMIEAIGFVSPFICNSFSDGVSESEHAVSNDWKVSDGNCSGLI
jgi:hypothetical protein